MSDWLDSDYTVPEASGGYLKFAQGENRIRILDKPIIGTEYWVEKDGKRKPIRIKPGESVPTAYADTAKHFWAMFVWDYSSKSIRVLEITQKGIMRVLVSLGRDKDWGSPVLYDVIIHRNGEGLETEYEVMPKPAKPLDPEIEKKWSEMKGSVDITRLYDGGDPFAVETINLDDVDV